MLTHLCLSNFKSWQHMPNMLLSPISGLFGTNSSGKTSVLQLLLLLKQTVESTDRAQVLEFGHEKSLTNLGSFHDVVFEHKVPGEFDFGLKWRLPETLEVTDPQNPGKKIFATDTMGFSCELREDKQKRLIVANLEYDVGSHRFSLKRKGESGVQYELSSTGGNFRFLRTPGRAWSLPAPVKFYGFPDQVYAYYQNAGFLADLQLAFEALLSRLYYLGPLREFPQRYYGWTGSEPADMGRRGERVVDAILAARMKGPHLSPGRKKRRQTLEERIAYWLKELGLIHSFSVKSIAPENNLYQVCVRKTAKSAEVLITDVGFGVSQILPVLVLCYYVPEGSIVLLEQPEIHLHPSVQAGLADVFLDAVKNRGIQIILESHSEHLLRRIQRRIAEEEIDRKEISLYFCESGQSGSTLLPLHVDMFGTILNWPEGFFGDEFAEIAATSQAMLRRQKRESA